MPPTSGLVANGGKPSHVSMCGDGVPHPSAVEAVEKECGSAPTGLEAKPADVVFSMVGNRQRLDSVREIRERAREHPVVCFVKGPKMSHRRQQVALPLRPPKQFVMGPT